MTGRIDTADGAGNPADAGDIVGSVELVDLRDKYAGEKDVISGLMAYLTAAHGKTLKDISAMPYPNGGSTHLDEIVKALSQASNRGVAVGIGGLALDGGITLYEDRIELKLKNPEVNNGKKMKFSCPYANRYNGSRR